MFPRVCVMDIAWNYKANVQNEMKTRELRSGICFLKMLSNHSTLFVNHIVYVYTKEMVIHKSQVGLFMAFAEGPS